MKGARTLSQMCTSGGSGATEHAATDLQCHECDFVAFCNIGLREESLLSKKHQRHEKHLQTQTEQLLTEHNVLGICFVECGNVGAGFSWRTKRWNPFLNSLSDRAQTALEKDVL